MTILVLVLAVAAVEIILTVLFVKTLWAQGTTRRDAAPEPKAATTVDAGALASPSRAGARYVSRPA